MSHFDEVNSFVKSTKLYPPSEIFAGAGSQTKAEKRITALCEDLYRFIVADKETKPLVEMQTAWREFEVIYKMGLQFIKPTEIERAKTNFLSTAKIAIKALDDLHKKDPILQQYYAGFKIKFADLSTLMYNITKDYK